MTVSIHLKMTYIYILIFQNVSYVYILIHKILRLLRIFYDFIVLIQRISNFIVQLKLHWKMLLCFIGSWKSLYETSYTHTKYIRNILEVNLIWVSGISLTNIFPLLQFPFSGLQLYPHFQKYSICLHLSFIKSHLPSITVSENTK